MKNGLGILRINRHDVPEAALNFALPSMKYTELDVGGGTEEDFETTEGEAVDLYDKLMEMVG